MDISVSHLNRRMASQIPAEFPLGLVFVVGKIAADAMSGNMNGLGEFYLLEEDHQLLCRLSPRASEDFSMQVGDLIRAGGHIVFDPSRARYFLLARDVELLGEDQPAAATQGGLTAASQLSLDSELASAPLPQWVKELAPLEVQEEWITQRMVAKGAILATAKKSVSRDEPTQTIEMATQAEPNPADLAVESWQEFGEVDVGLAYNAEEPALAELSDELIAFLSEAIDSSEVVELTPAILADLSPDDPPARTSPPAEIVAPEPIAPDPERAFAAQDVSIEEFLIALESAITADESRLDRQEVDVDSSNGQPAPDLISQSVDSPANSTTDIISAETTTDATAVAAANETALANSSQPDPDQPDQSNSVVPIEIEMSPDLPQKQPLAKVAPRRRKKRKNLLPWLIVLMAVVAGALLLAIFIVLVIGSGLIPSIAI